MTKICTNTYTRFRKFYKLARIKITIQKPSKIYKIKHELFQKCKLEKGSPTQQHGQF